MRNENRCQKESSTSRVYVGAKSLKKLSLLSAQQNEYFSPKNVFIYEYAYMHEGVREQGLECGEGRVGRKGQIEEERERGREGTRTLGEKVCVVLCSDVTELKTIT